MTTALTSKTKPNWLTLPCFWNNSYTSILILIFTFTMFCLLKGHSYSSNIWVQTWGWRLQNSLLEFPGKTWPCGLKWWLKHLILRQLWVQSFCLVLKSHILHFWRNEQVTQRRIRPVSINWYEIWKGKWEQSIPINSIKGLVQNYNMVTKCNN